MQDNNTNVVVCQHKVDVFMDSFEEIKLKFD